MQLNVSGGSADLLLASGIIAGEKSYDPGRHGIGINLHSGTVYTVHHLNGIILRSLGAAGLICCHVS